MMNQELYEVMDMVWDNYFTLSTTALEAMAIIWDEYANGTLFGWLNEEHGISESDFWEILTALMLHVKDMPNKRMPAMEVYAEWSKSR